MTGSTIKSAVPSDSAEEVRVTAAPSMVMPPFKEGARPPLAPVKTQREAGAKHSIERGWKQQDLRSIHPKHDTSWEKAGTREGRAEEAGMKTQRLMKGTIRREATETGKPNVV